MHEMTNLSLEMMEKEQNGGLNYLVDTDKVVFQSANNMYTLISKRVQIKGQ
jgi:hypothetical protein